MSFDNRHLIRFRSSPTLNLIRVPTPDGELTKGRGKVQRGATARVLLKPYVKNGEELCDMLFTDGSEAVGVRYASFQFVDEDKPECEGGCD